MDEPQPETESAPEPGSPPEPDPRIDKLLEKVTLLEQLFVKRIKEDPVHAAAYNSLYQEMVKYRDDTFRGSQKPLLKGIILLYDTMKRSLETVTELSGQEAITLHLEELVELLHRHDVELMTDPPEKFDPKVQSAIGTEDAETPEEDKAVVRVVRDGFRWGPHVLRPQEVVIKVYKEA